MKKLKNSIKKKKKFCIVLCTSPNKICTKNITQSLLQNKLAACITILPNSTSIYHWKKKIKKKTETQLIIKTDITLKKQIILNIKKNHTYDIPEILFLPIIEGEHKYLTWIYKSLYL
ncbi:Divalent-cation tolerance protein CutA [Candidatus Westeberhardia cardiocondylae]|uniref:Divalent-cation tolerance protein CutA n=1 Tax=Candidatus Westeberhardia cardiocondylae TaxID=1594731 RepID=A0A0H5BWK5_9ENTR|nr:divalent cation tolerance protein CutA [Candidatus Westeberhardia cardiocondylae]MCR3756380.1 copper binding protein CutA [Candidatus Westeberhardia cardiocondylae]CEN32085.1 Divalent-cation tolerance protein CutA [Candidatus Westeberhardia cardiocondylae]